jgi:hypothetical protein
MWSVFLLAVILIFIFEMVKNRDEVRDEVNDHAERTFLYFRISVFFASGVARSIHSVARREVRSLRGAGGRRFRRAAEKLRETRELHPFLVRMR